MSGVHARAAVAALCAALALTGCSTFQRGPRDPNAPLPLANSGPPTGRYEP
jgi:hypothetical protein